MLKQLMITTAAGALLTTAAWAQAPDRSAPAGQSTPPAATQSQGSGSNAASQDASKSQSSAMGGQSFVSTQKPDQWLASKFKGTDVLGSDDQKIGDISDILFDKSGKIEAFVVSVGGFLGMGAKDVAMPPSAFQVVSGDAGKGSTTGTGSGAGTAPRTAGSDPDDIKLKVSMNKDQLKNAQAFEEYKAPSATGSTGTNRPAGSGAGGMGGGANR